MVLQTVGAAATAAQAKVRQEAYECLVEICSSFYEELGDYTQSLLSLTTPAMLQDDEAVALQALEVWSTLAEVEIEVMEQREEADDDEEEGSAGDMMVAVAPALLPTLLELIQRQEEGQVSSQRVSRWAQRV